MVLGLVVLMVLHEAHGVVPVEYLGDVVDGIGHAGKRHVGLARLSFSLITNHILMIGNQRYRYCICIKEHSNVSPRHAVCVDA